MTLINTGKREHRKGGFFITCEGREYSLRLIHADENEVAEKLGRRRIHRHSVFHVIHTRSGKGTFILNGQGTVLTEGKLVIVSPGQLHCVGVNEEEDLCFGEVTFELLDSDNNQLDRDISYLFSQISGNEVTVPSITDKKNGRKTGAVENFLLQLNDFRASIGKEPYFHITTSSALGALLITLSGLFAGHHRSEPELTPIEKIRSYISVNYLQPLTLSDLSAIGSLSEKYLSRKFSETYGESPISYRDRLRMEMACELLTRLHYTIGEIADKCGYSDIYYFSRTFKKSLGISPGEYRKSGSISPGPHRVRLHR